ncbi:MAG: serine--tRNA ligase, partial [Patescibacteria group bacterium]|nr:serine--tRNA ligase [Patescibacteria group bacterium]
MLDIKFIRENPAKVKKATKAKGVNVDIDKLLKLDEGRRKLLHQLEDLKAKANKNAKKIGESKGKDKNLIKKGKELKNKIQKLEPRLKRAEKDLRELLVLVPNPTLPEVKV